MNILQKTTPAAALLAAVTLAPSRGAAAAAEEPIAVTTWHYDLQHTGQNLHERELTPQNVNTAHFGKLFTQPIDGYAYAQPLYVPNVNINVANGDNNGPHNVVFIATEHDSVYAFDADTADGKNSQPLWKVNFLDPQKQITTVPSVDVRSHDLVPEIGITGTPVIDRASNTLFVVAKTKELRMAGAAPRVHYVQTLYALDIRNGTQRPGSPCILGDCLATGDKSDPYHCTSILQYPGRGAPHDTRVDGRVVFNAFTENQRPALILLDGVVYIAWGSHADHRPVHGWLVGFRASDLSLVSEFNTSPDAVLDTIWMGGSSPAVDRDGSIIVSLGNGDFDADHGGRDYGESVIRIVRRPQGQQPWERLAIADYFCPADYQALNDKDNDLGSGGPLLLPDQAGPHPHELIVSGKEGVVYVLDRDHLGQINNPPDGPDRVVEEIPKNQIMADRGRVTASSINTAAYWNGFVYYTGHQRPIMQIPMHDGQLAHAPLHMGPTAFDFPFPTPQISGDGNQNVIVWLQSSGPNGALYAYDATDVSHQLWNSTLAGSRDRYGATVKFAMPIIANGKVYAAGQTTFAAFGLLHRHSGELAAVTNLSAAGVSAHEIDLAWVSGSDQADGYRIERSADGGEFARVGESGPASSSFHDAHVLPGHRYSYRVLAFNASGDGPAGSVATAAAPAAAVMEGLIGWWPMDEGTGNVAANAIASATGTTAGTISGEVSWVAGHVGEACLSFHGAGVAPGFVEVPHQPTMAFTAAQSFTLAAWVEPANLPDKWCGWITHAAPSGHGYGLSSNPHNQWVFGTADRNDNLAGGAVTIGWHLLTAVQDGPHNRRTLYLDGKPIATGPAADASGAGPLWIGGTQGDEEQYIDGSVDEVRLYRRALQPDEILHLLHWHNPLAPTLSLRTAGDGVQLLATLPAADFAMGDDAAPVIRFERSLSGGDWTDIAPEPAGAGIWYDRTAHHPSPAAARDVVDSYRYRARTTNAAGASAYSAVVQLGSGDAR